ncbi:methylenetetrahydrofolate reductase [Pedobacter sp. SL55]|uniref:methylenetetrahydrofolate reductase n=1 Tax=Pedobacter sp. SL55 TaxID=2995161 RepID=UPI002270D304|nr:methylenetetrahydrofolate reductase [Pedobacter sp. SL55]WAC42206.1 methylenetetrahydrofolate reductase [Pedobacter sp. SL55]
MKITEHIKNAKGKTLFSFELLPPIKGQGIDWIYNGIEPLLEFEPPFIDVTSLREDYIYKEHPNGLLQKVSYRKRPGTIAICAAIIHKYKIDAVPHLICGGFTKEETENALIDLQFLGIDNVLALRGDARKADSSFVPTPGGHAYATDLISHIKNHNEGKFLHEDVETFKSDFCIGVAGYPEKHFEAPNLNTDFKYLKQKVDLGAEFIVTQMFFDNQKYFEFVQKCRDNGINVPIIPGLKPISTLGQVNALPKIFHIDLPDELTEALSTAKNNAEAKEIGTQAMIKQCKELIEFGAPVLHFYTMGKPDQTKEIAKAVF